MDDMTQPLDDYGKNELNSDEFMNKQVNKPFHTTERKKRKSSIFAPEALHRGQWTGPLDFIMSLVAYAVGLGSFKFRLIIGSVKPNFNVSTT